MATSRGSKAAEKKKLLTEDVKRKPIVKKYKKPVRRGPYERYLKSQGLKASMTGPDVPTKVKASKKKKSAAKPKRKPVIGQCPAEAKAYGLYGKGKK